MRRKILLATRPCWKFSNRATAAESCCGSGIRSNTLSFWVTEKNGAMKSNAAACAADGIAVLRRSSGGGTVLQGPGCLNYTLILRQNNLFGPHVQAAFDFVLARHRRALEALTSQPVSVQGLSDLTLGERKFSGNAQYRKREYVLVHGTFLLHFDLRLIERYLRLPATQPEYRRRRSHCEFLVNAEVDPAKLRDSLRLEWSAEDDFKAIPVDLINRLMGERYQCAGWNEKF